MNHDHSKTLLRKGALKTHGGHAIPRHGLQRKTGTSHEEESVLLNPAPRDTAPPANRARMRSD